VIAHPSSVVLTAYVAHWADDHIGRLAWIADCLRRHNRRDWGDVDDHDGFSNDLALRTAAGPLLSRYPVPDELTDPTIDDDTIWIITDDVCDPDAITTILWPSEH